MKKFFCTATLVILSIITSFVSAQTRLNTHEKIGWYNFFGTFKLAEKWSLHTEYQWRRADYIDNWQQSLIRTGINYHLNPRVTFRVGYGLIETFAYGDIPINALERNFTEHRIYEMVNLGHKEGIFDFSHRFMLEQRFVGRYSNANVTKEDEFPLTNRLRYMIRMQLPIKGKEISDKTPYFAMYDEIFIGFGKNVKANVFDQNRVSLLLGYKFNKTLKIEGGYLSQIVQFGRQINNQDVYQYNNGFIVNLYCNFDLRKHDS
jgi:hypothetical protein